MNEGMSRNFEKGVGEGGVKTSYGINLNQSSMFDYSSNFENS